MQRATWSKELVSEAVPTKSIVTMRPSLRTRYRFNQDDQISFSNQSHIRARSFPGAEDVGKIFNVYEMVLRYSVLEAEMQEELLCHCWIKWQCIPTCLSSLT